LHLSRGKEVQRTVGILTGKEYEIIEYYRSGEYYVRRKAKKRLILRR